MTKKHIQAGLTVLVFASLLMTACSAQQTTPTVGTTVDANAIYTQAAQTVQAGMEKTEASRPTATQTATVAPTNTIEPTMAAGLTATSMAVLNPASAAQPTVAGQTPVSLTTTPMTTPLVLPTATKAVVTQAPAASTGDKCEWVDNTPKDNSQLKAKASYDATIVVKNTGTTTWDSRYALRFYAGDRLGTPTDFYVQGEVKPNDLYRFVFPITMPDSTGKKEALLVVQNADGRTMCTINLPIEVIGGDE